MKTKNLIIGLAAILLSSCAGFTHVTVPETNVNFIGKETEVVRMVSYTLPKTYILGIGGMSARARNTNVMDELMKRAALQQNETLAYITFSKNSNNYFGIINKVKFTASGYVIRPVEK